MPFINPTAVPRLLEGFDSFITVIVKGALPPAKARRIKEKRKIPVDLHTRTFANIKTQENKQQKHKITIMGFLFLIIWVRIPAKKTKNIVITIITKVKDAASFDDVIQIS